MTRGSTIKRQIDTGTILERRMVTRRYWFEWRRDRCVGCATCVAACPKDAIERQPGTVENGRLVTRPGIEIDSAKCVFCGACVPLCPVHALSMKINGQPEIPVLVWDAFPKLNKGITVSPDGLPPEKAAECVEICPTEVITVETARGADGAVVAVTSVRVDESDCIYCKECEVLCPSTFQVESPWEGRITLNVSLCPPGCQACVDICPTDALTWDNTQVKLDSRFCVYCGACQKVCPVQGAVVVARTRIRHAPIKSSAWTTALEKLISIEAAVRELEIKSHEKRRQVSRFLPGASK